MLKLWITALALLSMMQITPMFLPPEITWEELEIKNPKGFAFLIAAEKQDIEQVQMLLQEGVNVNTKGPYECTALYSAALNGNEKLCKLLIENGANPNCGYRGKPIWQTIIYDIRRTNHTTNKLAELLLNPFNLPTKRACSQAIYTLLCCLKQNKKKDLVSSILYNESKTLLKPHFICIMRQASHDINEKNKLGETLLMSAAKNTRSEVCAWLIAHGADVNIKNGTTTTLSIARKAMQNAKACGLYVYPNCARICELLIANGAKEDEAN